MSQRGALPWATIRCGSRVRMGRYAAHSTRSERRLVRQEVRLSFSNVGDARLRRGGDKRRNTSGQKSSKKRGAHWRGNLVANEDGSVAKLHAMRCASFDGDK
ncbi:hypothetical protein TRVL_07156 [Trypanosoma vivax]|nr:hypothetical protein TRVL_07156 [Trypanosoma vivax]